MRPTAGRAEAADDGQPGTETSLVHRRALLGWPAALACGSALTGCGAPAFVTVGATSPAPDPSPSPSPSPSLSSEEMEPVTPPEDLMREHGVLKRILLIYREGIRRIEGGEPVPAKALHSGAYLIRTFIEQYHEHLEEKYVFPALVKAGKLTDTVKILIQQHDRGRTLTARILNATGATPAPSAQARSALVADMAAFIRMYEPHEAREDTVVFPALREVVTPKQFAEMGEIFEDEEHRRFGTAGFTGIVNQVADIEKSLGIYDLAQFTPRT